MAPKELADDFAAWWGGELYSIDLVGVMNEKLAVETIAPKEKSSDRPGGVKAPVESSRPPAKPMAELPTSDGGVSHQAPAAPAAPIKDGGEGQTLHSVSPFFEVRRSPKGGYGAFALEDIPPFTDILFEPALFKAKSSNVLQIFDDLSMEEKDAYLKLATFNELSSNSVIATYKTNRFEIPGGTCGIFLVASRFNHSCLPTCTYRFDVQSEMLILTTKSKEILKGQEICISYGLTGCDLTWNYGFICDCLKCAPDGLEFQWYVDGGKMNGFGHF